MVVEGTLEDGSFPWRLPLIHPLVSSNVADPLWVHLQGVTWEEGEGEIRAVLYIGAAWTPVSKILTDLLVESPLRM